MVLQTENEVPAIAQDPQSRFDMIVQQNAGRKSACCMEGQREIRTRIISFQKGSVSATEPTERSNFQKSTLSATPV
jgi:hypothetical protein